jgi:flagellar biosynthesis GTPase FlhF
MRVNVVNHVVVATGISVVALLGLSVSAYATPREGQTQQQHQKNQQAQKKEGQAQKKEGQAQKKEDQAQAKQRHQALVNQQQQRLTQYHDHLYEQQRLAQAQSVLLEQQNRQAQYAVQQQYVARLHQQQVTVQRQAPATYSRDPYFSTPATYRYSRGGQFYDTNQYGVNSLRLAVTYGYDQGYRTGQADRHDRSMSNYEGSFAYLDANYGYNGFYVARDHYNDYFREGFRRGYADGYGHRSQYGTYVNGRGTILSAVLGTVFSVHVIVR